VLETSPGNYQAWLRIVGGDESLARRLVKGLYVDWNASGSVRLAGSPNCKEKYAPDFQAVRIAYSSTLQVRPEEVEDRLAPLVSTTVIEPVQISSSSNGKSRGWPEPGYEHWLAGAPKKNGKPDRSVADFFWCKLALERNNDSESVIAKLYEVSEKARERRKLGDHNYARLTVANALRAARI
jgi:hypothetical protein